MNQRAELFSRIYAFLGDRTINPIGYEWDHDRLRRLTTDLLAEMTAAGAGDRCATCGHSTAPLWFGKPGSGEHSEDDGSCITCGPELGKRCAS